MDIITEVTFAYYKVIIATLIIIVGNTRKKIEDKGQEVINSMISWSEANKLISSVSKYYN